MASQVIARRHPWTPPSRRVHGDEETVFSDQANGGPSATDWLATEHTPDSALTVATTPQILFVIATNPGSRARRAHQGIAVDTAEIKRQLHC